MNIDKAELAQKINALEGLDNETKSQLLELLHERKRYGLVWEEKAEDVEERLRSELPVLREVKERALLSKDSEAPNHILIEGDNLEALTALSYTHEGKIDVIYIDPPYNTGKEDEFLYNDKYIDGEDQYRHSKWLSFMAKRLKIARRLLSDKGVIFISIDDHEQAPLKLLCDEIFSEKNFCAIYNWKRTDTPPALSFKVRKKFEYILCYQKTDIPQRKFAQGLTDGGDAPLLNNGNSLGVLEFPSGSVHFTIPDGQYSNNDRMVIDLLDSVVVQNGVNQNSFKARGHFKWSQNNLINEVQDGTYFLIKGKSFSPRYQKSSKAIKIPSNVIDSEVFVGTNEEASKEMDALNIKFDYAKPTSLIRFLLNMPMLGDHYSVLDFFAGSGTTLHATIQLNSIGGNRKCILVQASETTWKIKDGIKVAKKGCEGILSQGFDNIAEITYERNKRVINGYTTPKGEKIEGLHNNNLRYYKTDFVARESSLTAKKELMTSCTDLLCIKEDIYTEHSKFGTLSLRATVARYFSDGDRQMLIIYNPEAIERIAEEINKMDIKEPIAVYIFSLNDYAYDADFADVDAKVRLCALPAAIYRAYLKVLPKKYQPKASEDQPINELNFEED